MQTFILILNETQVKPLLQNPDIPPLGKSLNIKLSVSDMNIEKKNVITFSLDRKQIHQLISHAVNYFSHKILFPLTFKFFSHFILNGSHSLKNISRIVSWHE